MRQTSRSEHHHASLDPGSRALKAKKIDWLVSQRTTLDAAQVLDIGTGSGDIAGHLSRRVGNKGQVYSVDVVDVRQTTNAYEFIRTEGVTLPFSNETFDLVISNHVIEHVGNSQDQQHHLSEARRVLKRQGILYLATPNRAWPIEPHYKLPILSVLPKPLQDHYVRLTGRGNAYDCLLLSRRQLIAMMRSAGFTAMDVTAEAVHYSLQTSTHGALRRIRNLIPAWLIRTGAKYPPSMILVGQIP